MNRRENLTAWLAVRDDHAQHARAPLRRDSSEVAIRQAKQSRVGVIDLNKRFGQMAREPWARSRARHGVPLVAHAPCVKSKRVESRGLGLQRGRFRRDETGASVEHEEVAVAEQSRAAFALARRGSAIALALKRRSLIRETREAAQIEVARTVILESRQRRMFAKHIGDLREVESRKAHALADLRKNEPIGARLSGRRHKSALARNTSLGIRHRAVLFTPGLGGKQHMRPCVDRVVREHIVRDDKQFELFRVRRGPHRRWAETPPD